VPGEVLRHLEEDLGKLTKLTTGDWIQDQSPYFRQYVGITIRGKKYVYINAFRRFSGESDGNSERWKYEAVVGCDGGNYFWGALYNPETREFSELFTNVSI
jgi:hypothetical protein